MCLHTVTILPATPFEIDFPPNTFVGVPTSELFFYATLADRTPLPAWLAFDSTALRFTGTTPAVSKDPMQVNVTMSASSVAGFAEASVVFGIMVSQHEFVFEPVEYSIRITENEIVHLTNLRSKLLLDGNPVQDADLAGASASVPNWLDFDPRTFEISGKPPKSPMKIDITIQARDVYGDSSAVLIHLDIGFGGLFDWTIGILNATAGQPFSFQLQEFARPVDKLIINIDFGTLSRYLSFDTDTLMITGTIPESVEPQTVSVKLEVEAKDQSAREEQIFQIIVCKCTKQSVGES